jgi:type IV secretory pathway VirB2 component (pilin)
VRQQIRFTYLGPQGTPNRHPCKLFVKGKARSIATGLSLVAIVVGGLMFAYGEGQSKRTLAGIVFGVGMAIGAVKFLR